VLLFKSLIEKKIYLTNYVFFFLHLSFCFNSTSTHKLFIVHFCYSLKTKGVFMWSYRYES